MENQFEVQNLINSFFNKNYITHLNTTETSNIGVSKILFYLRLIASFFSLDIITPKKIKRYLIHLFNKGTRKTIQIDTRTKKIIDVYEKNWNTYTKQID